MDTYHVRAFAVMGIVGLVAGGVMNRSGYCFTAMFRDIFLTRSLFLLRTLAVALGLGAAAIGGLRFAGIEPTIFFPPASLATLLGGMLFGLGMVSAGGCVIGTLFRMGEGRLLSFVAFGGLIAGNFLYAEFHPAAARFAKATLFFGGTRSLPQLVGLRPLWLALAFLALSLWLWRRWARKGLLDRKAPVKGYVEPKRAALLLMGVNVLAVAATAIPMGVTTTYAKAAAWIESLVAPEHAAGLAYFSGPGAAVKLPAFGTVFTGGAAPVFDSVAAVQLPLIVGIAAGSFLSALSVREFAWRWRAPPRQYVFAFAGGVLMTLGARIGGGCNIFHLLGGVPALAAGSFVFVAGLFPGAWLGGVVLTRIILRLGPVPLGGEGMEEGARS